MDEKLQKDIFNVLQKHKRFDLINMILTIIDDIDSDYESEEQDEPDEEYFECGAIPEDPSYCISDDGFYYLM